MARVCELYIGFDVPIGLIATIENIHIVTVSTIVSRYLGTHETPIYFNIDITDDIEGE
jgi:hypothetical protein